METAEAFEKAFTEKVRQMVKRPEAADAAARIYGQYAVVYGSVPTDIEHILMDIAALEDDKLAAREYIRQKGVMEEFVQGRQRIRRENKCVAMFSKLSQAQARLIGSLKLSAGSVPEEKEAPEGADDEFDNF